MTHATEDYFIGSPFHLPFPEEMEEDDFALPSSMIQEQCSARLRRHHPAYCLPPPPSSVFWPTPPLTHPPLYRILIHRHHAATATSILVHDYVLERCRSAIGGWIRRYCAYYYREQAPFSYNEYAHGQETRCDTSLSSSPASLNILSSCALPASAAAILPRILRRPVVSA